MSVRRMKRRDPKTGAAQERWFVDVDYQVPNGQRVRVRKVAPVQSRRGAEEYERQVRQALLDGSYNSAEGKEVPKVSEFSERFMTFSKTNNRPSTIYAKEWMMRLHILPFFGAMRLDTIGPAEIEAYKAKKLGEKQNKKSINNHLTALRKLMNLAGEYNVLARVPKIRGFKVKSDYVTDDEFLTFEEAERIIHVVSPAWRTFVTVALKTGLRAGELLALMWQDVDLVAGQLVVRRTLWQNEEGPPKGGRPRTVPLSDAAVSTLRAHRHLRGPYVFCDEAGKRLTHSAIKDVVPSLCARAGLAKRLTTHGLRHTFASHLVMRGKSLKAVQELLGHESIEMTLRYAHLSPDVKRDAVQALDEPAAPSNGNLTATDAGAVSSETKTPGKSVTYRGQDGAGKGI